MIKKYPWHFVFLIFVIFFLTNIFQKLQWKESTDNLHWIESNEGLICDFAPKSSHIHKGDILFTINKYIIKNRRDLKRVIENKKLCVYEIERDDLIKKTDVEIDYDYTPTSYYILVLPGIILLLITLMFLNITLKKGEDFTPPKKFYLLSLSLSSLLIFSPTGSYGLNDFVFLFFDRIAYLFFPAFLVNYSFYFPLRSNIFKKFRSKMLSIAIFIPPFVILLLYSISLFSNFLTPVPEIITSVINYFREISYYYFGTYLLIALIFFINSSLKMIFGNNNRRFFFPLIGISISIPAMIIFNFIEKYTIHTTLLNIFLFTLILLPVSLTYFLSHRKFSDIENVIKKTLSISLILFFIFGIFFFLGFNIEKNKIIGIFWSVIAIITAGLLFKPIEGTIQEYFEKIFLRGTFNFKKKLMELIQSLRSERDLYSLSENLLSTINNGFHLKKTELYIHIKKKIYHSYPSMKKIVFSGNFINDLLSKENLILTSYKEFEKKYPKDANIVKQDNFLQFLPLKHSKKLIGVIAFSFKTDDTYLSQEDWDLLFSITSSLTLSIENASLYSELENQLNEINLLKEFHENVIENINMGMVVLTNLNIVKTWNRFMESKFNIPVKKALNKKAFQVFGNKLWKDIYPNMSKQSTMSNINITLDNKDQIFNIHISPLKDIHAKTIGTILVFEDVTENTLMQNQLITSEKMASIGLLSAGIAHEVNTPLTGISSYCQLILSDPDNPENNNLVLKMQDQIERANKIIRTLLDFSRQKGENPVELDIKNLISESISLVEHKLKKKKIKLIKDLNFNNMIFGFSTRLQQLFINLLINASDAIDNELGEIVLKGYEENGNMIIKVKDNGRGIEREYQKNIFEPFFTTKERGEGTGLGLSIIYNIVEEHYGKINFHSNPGKGSTFTIILPLKSPLRSIKI